MTALGRAYTGITAVVADLDDRGFVMPTGCPGWSIADLLLHLTHDAQRALVALASPVDGPADVNAVTYWRSSTDITTDDALSHDQWLRRSAAAFTRPTGIRQLWLDTAPAAVRAAAAADRTGFITTQGHVLSVPDFVATLVTEAAIHHLDLISALPGAPGPDPEVTVIARSTLDGLAGPPGLPAGWDDHEALFKGSGRMPLTDVDRRDVTATFPLLA